MKENKVTKKVKTNKIKNIKQVVLNQELKAVDKDGYPVKQSKECCFCNQKFVLTFSFSQQNYSRKHFLNFWTENKSDVGKFTCSSCLRSYYFDLERRRKLSLKKVRRLSSYIAQNFV
jgi:hypothetical protein